MDGATKATTAGANATAYKELSTSSGLMVERMEHKPQEQWRGGEEEQHRDHPKQVVEQNHERMIKEHKRT